MSVRQYLTQWHTDVFIVMTADQLSRLFALDANYKASSTHENSLRGIWLLDVVEPPKQVTYRTLLLSTEPADGGTRSYHVLQICTQDHDLDLLDENLDLIDEARYVGWAR